MFAALMFVLWMVVGPIVRGLVLVKLWAWFLVPNLAVPQIGAAQALGIALLVSMLTHQVSGSDESKNEDKSLSQIIGVGLLTSVLAPLIILLIGAIFHAFM